MGWPDCGTNCPGVVPRARSLNSVTIASVIATRAIGQIGESQAFAASPGLADEVSAAALELVAFCRANDWGGYDPYDALNSRLFGAVPFLDFRLARVAFTQALKRLPVNIRPLMLIPKKQNPKALALFISALLNLRRTGLVQDEAMLHQLADLLIAAKSAGQAHFCWGYSFPWQTRTVLVPSGSPNLVCTTFAANALLDLFEVLGDGRYLDIACSAADYIANELFWTEGESVASFDYPLPGCRSRVHNANLLAAALLLRVESLCHTSCYATSAMQAARYSVGCQRADGSWPYGELVSQQWVDNFHTGFNLCALRRIGEYAATDEFHESLQRGFEFYRRTFFLKNGAPKYFQDRAYPFDVHSVAQSLITLVELKAFSTQALSLANAVFDWAMANLRDPSGYFYYRKLPWLTIKINFMRWSQAWMLLALSVLAQQPSEAR